jgi:uncharacterized protein YehS (DUF1456 family)
MNNTTVLRNVASALALDHADLSRIFALSGLELAPEQLDALQRDCPDDALAQFLDGLILDRRGPPKNPVASSAQRLTNNAVLKKLRIALDLKEPALLGLMSDGGLVLTKHELTPLFRKPGSKHFKSCPDAVLEAFFTGVALDPSFRTPPL